MSNFFTEPISPLGRDFSEHFWETDRKRKQFKLLAFCFNFNWSSSTAYLDATDNYRVSSIAAFKLQANTDYLRFCYM